MSEAAAEILKRALSFAVQLLVLQKTGYQLVERATALNCVKVFAIEVRGVGERLAIVSQPVMRFNRHDVKTLVNVGRAGAEVLGLDLKLLNERLGFLLGLEES